MKSSKKIPKTFISFLIISFLIWLLITFSKEYTTVISYPVDYQNIAQNKLFQESPIKEIDISIKASGFKVLKEKLWSKKIDLDASRLNRKGSSKFYFLPKNQQNKIQKQMISGVDLQEILQDTIYLNLGVLASKKVELIPDLDINYHIGYDLLDEIKIVPDSIIISGPESQLNEILNLSLNKLVLSDVKSDFSKEVSINISDNGSSLKTNILTATVSGKVDKFTEGSLQIPFTIINLPKNTNLTILTEEVEVVFVVVLSNFSKVSEASFKIECDYNISEKNNLRYLIPKVVSQPNFIKNIKIIPSKIDFLIQK